VAIDASVPVIALEPADIALVGDTATVQIVVRGAPPTTGFQAELTYDPELVAIVNATLGEFLPGSGRAVQPLGPNLDTPGRVVLGAISAGADPAPPSGDGVLARLDIAPIGDGEGSLEIVAASLVDASNQVVSVQVESAALHVTGAVPEKSGTEYAGRAATLAAAPPATVASEYLRGVQADAGATSTARAAGGEAAAEIGEAATGVTASGTPVASPESAPPSGSPLWWLAAILVVVIAGGLWALSRRG
jgi:hypothetical protein